MKQKISFLAIVALVLNANCIYASECVGDDCELTQIETVDILVPVQKQIDWSVPVVEETVCEIEHNYFCPFESDAECDIWYKKPSYKVSVAPREPHINPIRVDDILLAIYSNPNISGNDDVMQPLMQRYQMLMNASDACCTSGIIYKMRENDADDKDVYEFLKDDANYFAVTKRCMVMDDENISRNYSNGVNGEMVTDVRNACLCKNQKWFNSLLQPFVDIYERNPEFAEYDFTYKYVDGLQREITVSVNEEIQTALGLLSACPK